MKATLIFKKIKFLLCFLLLGCSSSNLVEQYTNPDIHSLEIKKVLIIGMTPNKNIRRIFEEKVAEEFLKRKVIAVGSIDFFESSFTEKQKTEEQLNKIRIQLSDANFDAVLLAKVTGQEEKVTIGQAYKNFSRNLDSFTDYYYHNQEIYGSTESETYVLYHTETSLYCLCPATDRRILYKASIDLVDTERINKNINNYIKILFKSLKDNQVILK